MATPVDVDRNRHQRMVRERQARRVIEEIELSVNSHYANDQDCDHHCDDCCPALHLLSTS